jgi:S-adenosylmethionine hydrolase
MTSRRIITLTTDFGLRDHYVAAMKGVALDISMEANLIDVSHDVEPQNIAQAGFLVASIWAFYPDDAIHVAVVDPGVGTNRKPIAVHAAHGIFIAPDNGLLAPALLAQGALQSSDGLLTHAAGVELINSTYHRTPVSPTFHGRDIFMPVAAHLSTGADFFDLGPMIEHIVCDQVSNVREESGVIRGTVVHIDRFGNAITNISGAVLPPRLSVSVVGATVVGLSLDYQAAEVVAIVGSSGSLEIAVRNGSAAEELGLKVGDEVTVSAAT